MSIQTDYIERLYAGWLGKLIGVRLGAPIEGWTYDKIRRLLGENVRDYIADYNDFASDDDINGPMFFVRALEDYECSENLTAEQIGKTWLNYTPYQHGFYWWGGYGVSTEHTAYLNLAAGIPAPRSGSIEQNGATVAEQIGGQIFIDCWGLINPGEPERAARFARKAASVSHDGNGIYGGQFVAACIASAFTAKSVREIIETGLSVIPTDCEYARVARDIIRFHDENPDDWRACFNYIHANYGYDRYPGNCHIIPNSAVMILALMYGSESFTDTVSVCNMCGWDTDCTTGNVGTIIGVFCGLDGIDEKWTKPIHDFIASSCVLGCLNIIDAPSVVFYMAKLGYKLAGEAFPEKWAKILNGDAPKYNFALPKSTHSFRLSGADVYQMKNIGGKLGIWAQPKDGEVRVFQKTHYGPKDFTDNRYTPFFSPILYPGQTVTAHVTLSENTESEYYASIYVYDENGKRELRGKATRLVPNAIAELRLDIPAPDGGCIGAAGILFEGGGTLEAAVIDMDFIGAPDYTLDFSKEYAEIWTPMQREVHQMGYFKGLWTLENGLYHGSAADIGEAYTGNIDWTDVETTCEFIPIVGEAHRFMLRVQGAARCYAAALSGNKLQILKKIDGKYTVLAETDYLWTLGKDCRLTFKAIGNVLSVSENRKTLLEYADNDSPYLFGAVGFGVTQGHCAFKKLAVKGM